MKPSISIIKERKENERRVILTPSEVSELVDFGCVVYAEHNCGLLCGYGDDLYKRCGAEIVSQQDAWQCADITIKYKAPLKCEYDFFSDKTVLAALFHAEGDRDLLRAMINSKMTAYSFEFFETDDGFFPLAYPGGEIAGKSAVLYAAHYLQNNLGGKGKLLCDITGIKRPRIGIIGYGSVGSAAISLSIALGCEVVVFGQNMAKLRKLQINYGNQVKIIETTHENLERVVPTLDVLIGAILISTYDTDPIITEDMIQKMEPGSVVVDVTCGYGSGYMPFIKGYTTFKEPVQRVGDINCIKIDMLPSAYHQTTTAAYASNLLPYLKKFLKAVSSNSIDQTSQRGCIISKGNIIHPEIQKHWNYYERN